MKKGIVLTIVLLVAVAVVFFAFFWPLNDNKNLSGSIAGVQKAEKYRGEQFSEGDLLVENESFINLIQSAEWQNAIKNPELLKMMASDDFKKYIILSHDIQKFRIMALDLQKFFSFMPEKGEITKDTVEKIFRNQEFQQQLLATNAEQLQQPIYKAMAQQLKYVLLANDSSSFDQLRSMKEEDAVAFLLANSSEFQNMFSQDFQKLVLPIIGSADFQELLVLLNSQDFQQDFLFSVDYQQKFMSVVLGVDFQELLVLLNSQDYQQLINSEDFQSFLATSDKNGTFPAVFAQDFQNFLLNRSNL